jgi:hypothetical protein
LGDAGLGEERHFSDTASNRLKNTGVDKKNGKEFEAPNAKKQLDLGSSPGAK